MPPSSELGSISASDAGVAPLMVTISPSDGIGLAPRWPSLLFDDPVIEEYLDGDAGTALRGTRRAAIADEFNQSICNWAIAVASLSKPRVSFPVLAAAIGRRRDALQREIVEFGKVRFEYMICWAKYGYLDINPMWEGMLAMPDRKLRLVGFCRAVEQATAFLLDSKKGTVDAVRAAVDYIEPETAAVLLSGCELLATRPKAFGEFPLEFLRRPGVVNQIRDAAREALEGDPEEPEFDRVNDAQDYFLEIFSEQGYAAYIAYRATYAMWRPCPVKF